MQVLSVTNPVWANEQHTAVDCMVEFDEFSPEFLPFTATPNDVTTYGPQIFNDCVAGVYGLVGEYVPPPPYIPTAADNKSAAEQRLQATDWVNEPDVYDPARNPHLMNRDEFLDYRAWCRNIAVYPVAGNLDWPSEPVAVWSQA